MLFFVPVFGVTIFFIVHEILLLASIDISKIDISKRNMIKQSFMRDAQIVSIISFGLMCVMCLCFRSGLLRDGHVIKGTLLCTYKVCGTYI